MLPGGLVWSFAVVGAAVATSLAAPSDVIIDDLPGFELTSGPAVDLEYDGYFALQPESIAHLDPASEQAAGMVGAIETWSDRDSNVIIVVEVVRAIDDASATTFVDQAAGNAIAIGLAAADPPFSGAWSYSGGFEDTWEHVVSWNQGPFAVVMTQLSLDEVDRDPLDAAAFRQVELILAATGFVVSEEAAVVADAPAPPTEPTEPPPVTTPEVDDERGPATVAFGVAGIVALVAMLVVLRRARAG